MNATAPRLLLVTPVFHDYGRSIAEAFTRRGHDVTTLRYDAYQGLAEKARLKATVELPERLPLPGPLSAAARRAAERRRLTERALALVRELRPDRLVVIKGDALEDRFWEETARIPRILWLYDDLHRHEYTLDFLREVGPVVDYAESETDALREAGVEAHCVPNAFDPYRAADTGVRRHELTFIGSGYENRRRILTALHDRGLRVHAWGREFSRHPVDRARTFSWRRPAVPASREVPLERAYQLHAEGAAGIAIHGLQNGHAMRTFEIPGMGGVQLVDREDVSRYYDIGTEVALWRDLDELAELGRRALRDRAWGEGLRAAGRARTLAEHTFDHRIEEVDSLWP